MQDNIEERGNTSCVQWHAYNGLLRPVQARDAETVDYLLKKGASPTFRGINQICGFDAVNLKKCKEDRKAGHPIAPVATILALLKQHMTDQHDPYTPYPLKGVNSCYKEKTDIEEYLKG